VEGFEGRLFPILGNDFSIQQSSAPVEHRYDEKEEHEILFHGFSVERIDPVANAVA
jgi:hypothetical protein